MNLDPPSVAVVIPAYGPVPNLEKCLAALESQKTAPTEIIVFHSGSCDPALGLGERFPKVRFMHDDTRHYAGRARNKGANEAKGEWLAFLDSDMIPHPHWLEAIAKAARQFPQDAFFGSIGRSETGGAWSVAMWFIECGSVLPHRKPQILTSGPGANFVVRRIAFETAGGFAGDIYAAEDGELVTRLGAGPGALRLVPAAQADHVFPGGTRHSLKRLHELGRAAAFLRRHRDLPGSAAVRRPALVALLPLARFIQIFRRVLFERGPLLKFLVASPLIALGLTSWAIGFWQEARKPTYPDLGQEPPQPPGSVS